MNEVIGQAFSIDITGWKLVGYLGVLLFAGRWVVQVWAARRHGKVVIPRLFWTMSMLGSALLLVYFTFGKNDSVGVLSNLFPMAVALYNWFLDVRGSASRPFRQGSARQRRMRPERKLLGTPLRSFSWSRRP